MKMFIKILIVLYLCVSFYGCSTRSDYNSADVYSFKYDDFMTVTSLTAEVVKSPIDINPMLFNLIDDSLILVRGWASTPYYMELYRKNDLSFITRIAKRGKGPNEFLSAYFSYKTLMDGSFMVFDIIKHEAARFSIDSLLMLGESYKPEKFAIPPYVGNDIDLINDTTVLHFNKYYVSNRSYKNNVDPIHSYSISGNNNFEDAIKKVKYFTHNVTDAFTAIHPSKEKIWLIYQKENRIEIYNKELQLVKTLLGPEEFVPEYQIRESDNNRVTFSVSTRTYWYPFFTEDHLYVIYFGEYNKKRSQPVNVFKFTWDGELLHRYLLDRNLYTIYVDSKEEYIYGTDYIPDEYPKLVRYKIN